MITDFGGHWVTSAVKEWLDGVSSGSSWRVFSEEELEELAKKAGLSLDLPHGQEVEIGWELATGDEWKREVVGVTLTMFVWWGMTTSIVKKEDFVPPRPLFFVPELNRVAFSEEVPGLFREKAARHRDKAAIEESLAAKLDSLADSW